MRGRYQSCVCEHTREQHTERGCRRCGCKKFQRPHPRITAPPGEGRVKSSATRGKQQ